jgi:hypothetical protein
MRSTSKTEKFSKKRTEGEYGKPNPKSSGFSHVEAQHGKSLEK